MSNIHVINALRNKMNINSATSAAQASQSKPAITSAVSEKKPSDTLAAPIQQDTVTLSEEAKEKSEAQTQGGGWGNEPPQIDAKGGGWGNEPKQQDK
jgi:hypothetical protein